MECCEFTGPAVVGDAAAVIVIESGTPNSIDGVLIYAEACVGASEGGYEDLYSDSYSDPTEGGLFPNARITDIVYEINDMPADAILTIDAAERTITLTDSTGNIDLSQLGVIDWNGLFEWIEAAKSGCQSICIDDSGGTVNANTAYSISTFDREL